MSAGQSETRSQEFPRPYEGSGKYYLEDDMIVAVNQAIEERGSRQRAARTARAQKLVESGMVQVNLMQSRLSFTEGEITDSKEALERLAREARFDSEPFDTTKLPQYRKHPYPTVAGSCVNRAPRYDGGQASTWGATLGGGVRVPSGSPQNGNLGGTCDLGLAGMAGVTAYAGIFFFSGDHCGTLSVTSSFLTTGYIDVFSIWGAGYEAITLRTSIWGSTERAWLADTGFDLANIFEVLGEGQASFENQPDTVSASCDVKSNRTYWIQAETQIAAAVGGGAGCDCEISTSLTDIQACL